MTDWMRPAMVSPPTRGWTLVHAFRHVHVDGFPAHAGMDPLPGRHRLRDQWFPRPRGDGPFLFTDIDLLKTVSPPTRGWTLNAAADAMARAGFPAHAGMDLYLVTGDADNHWVSPPTRGWT